MGLLLTVTSVKDKNCTHDFYRGCDGWELLSILGKIAGYVEPHSWCNDQPDINDLDGAQVIEAINRVKNYNPQLNNKESIIDFLEGCKDGCTVYYSF